MGRIIKTRYTITKKRTNSNGKRKRKRIKKAKRS